MALAGAQAAVLIGLVLAACVSAMTVIMAFARHAMRFIGERAHGGVTYADRLCAGICITAAGTLVAGIGVFIFLTFGHVVPWLMYIGWSLMGCGYFFQFGAWHGAAVGKFGWFRIAWAVVLLAIAAGAAIVFLEL